MLLFPLFPNFIFSQTYSNTPLTQSSGIFYNNKGIARISNTKLTLLTHMNTTYLEQARKVLKANYIKSLNLCTMSSEDPTKGDHVYYHCEQTLKSINDELRDIENKHQILNQLIGKDSDNRKRRGIINGVSYALNWLFGTPDADDAQYYTNSINMLLNDNKQTQTLMKSQIQIISSTIRNFNHSLASLKNSEDTMNDNINRINKFSAQTNTILNTLEVRSIIGQQIATLLSLTNRISAEYNKYIEAINLGRHNILSPLIVSPKILVEELVNYKSEYELVVPPNLKNLSTLYKLMNLQLVFVDNIIIFALNFPLVTRTVFDLYNLIPLPVQLQNTSIFSYIIPNQPYLIISQSKVQFSFLQDLLNCILYLDGKYVCMEIHTKKSSDQPTCEVQLLAPHVKKIPEDCNTRTIKAGIETWTYINNNQWLYVLQKPTTLTIICKKEQNQIEDVVLHQTGILHLESQCIGYTNLYSLEPTTESRKNITHYVPLINLVASDCCLVNMEDLQISSAQLKPILLTNIDLSDFKYAKKKLNEFDQILTSRLKEPFIVTHTHWYTIALAIVAAVLFIIIHIYKLLSLVQPFQNLTKTLLHYEKPNEWRSHASNNKEFRKL